MDGKRALIPAAAGHRLGDGELFVAEGAKVVAQTARTKKAPIAEQALPRSRAYAHVTSTMEADIVAALALAKSAYGGPGHPVSTTPGPRAFQGRRSLERPRAEDKVSRADGARDGAGMHHAMPCCLLNAAGVG